MNHDPLIDRLASELSHPQRSPYSGFHFGSMILMSLGASLILLGLCGARADLSQAWDRQNFFREFLVLALMPIFAYALAQMMMVPMAIRYLRRMLLMFSFLFLTAVPLMFLQHPDGARHESFLAGAGCFVLIALSGILPLIFSLRLLRSGSSTRPRISMALAVAGAFGASIAVQHIICANENPWHLIAWHLGMLPLGFIVAWFLGPRVLRW